jgi:hypothetical protein
MFVHYPIVIIILHVLASYSLILSKTTNVEESEAFAARQARQIVQEEGGCVINCGFYASGILPVVYSNAVTYPQIFYMYDMNVLKALELWSP